MKFYKFLIVGALLTLVYSGVSSAADERKAYGWGGAGGANLTMFSKDHDNPASRAGELAFIYGGSATAAGTIRFLHYNGTAWNERMTIDQAGLLRVPSIKSSEINVLTNIWADYVFKPSYDLRPLEEVEVFITENGHLPGIPSGEEVQKNGVDIGKMNVKMMEKIEELTLYVIELKKENNKIKSELAEMREQ